MSKHELAVCLYIGMQRIAPWRAYQSIGKSRIEYLLTALCFAGVDHKTYRHIPFAAMLEQGEI